MSKELLFQLSNTLSLLTWLVLLIAPYWKWTGRIVIGGAVTLLCVLYACLVLDFLGGFDPGSFGSLAGVMELFTSPRAVLAGWVHYLAFDLMVGWFIVTNAAKHGMNRYLLIPCLLLTFIFGPMGLLLYLAVRAVALRKHFVD